LPIFMTTIPTLSAPQTTPQTNNEFATTALEPKPVVVVSELTVRYGKRTILENFSLTIPEGCTGLLGPNGAGKTTLIKTLMGFLTPASGTAQVLNRDVASERLRIRQHIGFMPEQDCHIPGMNAVAFVAYAGELAGMPSEQALRRAHEVLEYCGLGEARYREVETYSTGMKQRIKLAQALVHGPDLLFLDEPTNGLDPQGRDGMLDLIRDISHGKGLSVVVCSHLLPDIERTCDHVIVMQTGKVRQQGPISTLRQHKTLTYEIELKEFSPAFVQSLAARGGSLERNNGALCQFTFPAGVESIGRRIFEAAQESQTQVRKFRETQRSLEEIFMEALEE